MGVGSHACLFVTAKTELLKVAWARVGMGAEKKQTQSDLEGEIASDSEARTQENTTKADNDAQLKAVMDYLKEIAPGCDFIAMNFNIRLTNRQMEVKDMRPPKKRVQNSNAKMRNLNSCIDADRCDSILVGKRSTSWTDSHNSADLRAHNHILRDY